MSAFDARQRTFQHRKELKIKLRLAQDSEPVNATLFTRVGERASDLLNDNRAFIPVRLVNGETMIVAKSQIASITEAAEDEEEPVKPKFTENDFKDESKAQAKAVKSFDVYATLNIKPEASNDEVRAAYKARMKVVHPDAIASLGLDEEIARAAVLAAQKVNYAYNKIMRERGAVDKVA